MTPAFAVNKSNRGPHANVDRMLGAEARAQGKASAGGLSLWAVYPERGSCRAFLNKSCLSGHHAGCLAPAPAVQDHRPFPCAAAWPGRTDWSAELQSIRMLTAPRSSAPQPRKHMPTVRGRPG